MHLLSFVPFTRLAAEDALPEIRQFNQATLEKLGAAIYEQDIRAARATDMLFTKKIPSSYGRKACEDGLSKATHRT